MKIYKEKKQLWQIVPPLIQVWYICQKTSDQLIDISHNQWLISPLINDWYIWSYCRHFDNMWWIQNILSTNCWHIFWSYKPIMSVISELLSSNWALSNISWHSGRILKSKHWLIFPVMTLNVERGMGGHMSERGMGGHMSEYLDVSIKLWT